MTYIHISQIMVQFQAHLQGKMDKLIYVRDEVGYGGSGWKIEGTPSLYLSSRTSSVFRWIELVSKYRELASFRLEVWCDNYNKREGLSSAAGVVPYDFEGWKDDEWSEEPIEEVIVKAIHKLAREWFEKEGIKDIPEDRVIVYSYDKT